MMKKPLVSVVMATFNEPVDYIRESIESILKQTYKNFEFIIVDDSTKPDTVEAINAYAKDKRVKIIRENSRMGFVRALNQGLRVAKGEYIVRMDGDDISLKDRFERQLNFFKNHNEIDVLGGNMLIINETSEIVSVRKYPNHGLWLQLNAIFRSPVAHPTVMFRRSILENHFFYDETFKKAEDTEFWFRLRNNGFKFANLPHNLLMFRISGDLAKKRNVEHFSYNFRARYKNFSWKYFYVDIPSVLTSKLYLFIPSKIISYFYSVENKKYA